MYREHHQRDRWDAGSAAERIGIGCAEHAIRFVCRATPPRPLLARPLRPSVSFALARRCPGPPAERRCIWLIRIRADAAACNGRNQSKETSLDGCRPRDVASGSHMGATFQSLHHDPAHPAETCCTRRSIGGVPGQSDIPVDTSRQRLETASEPPNHEPLNDGRTEKSTCAAAHSA
jgi:hypothetical protein